MIAKVNCTLADVLPPVSRDTVDLPRSPHHPDAEIGHIMAPCLYLHPSTVVPQPPWVLASTPIPVRSSGTAGSWQRRSELPCLLLIVDSANNSVVQIILTALKNSKCARVLSYRLNKLKKNKSSRTLKTYSLHFFNQVKSMNNIASPFWIMTSQW